jgi:hypothetical protein
VVVAFLDGANVVVVTIARDITCQPPALAIDALFFSLALHPHAARVHADPIHADLMRPARLRAVLRPANPPGALLPLRAPDRNAPPVRTHPRPAYFHHSAGMRAVHRITKSIGARLTLRTIHIHTTTGYAFPLKTHLEGPRTRLRLAIHRITITLRAPLTLRAIRPDTAPLFAPALDAYFLLPQTGLCFTIHRIAKTLGTTLHPGALHPDAGTGNAILIDAHFPPSWTGARPAGLRIALPFHASLVLLATNIKTTELDTAPVVADKVFGTITILAFLHIAYAIHQDSSVALGGVKSAPATGIHQKNTQNPKKILSVPMTKHLRHLPKINHSRMPKRYSLET